MKKRVLLIIFVAIFFVNWENLHAQELFATKNGKKYHQEKCMLAKDKGLKAISKEEADQRKLLPCRHCFRQQVEVKVN